MLTAATRSGRTGLIRKLPLVSFEPGERFWPERESAPFALFPLRGIISLRLPSPPSRQLEVALVGPEGFAGLSLLTAFDNDPLIPVALTGGEAVIMDPGVLRASLRTAGFRLAVQKYMRFFVLKLSRLAVCNRIHVIEQIVAGQLLRMQDRYPVRSFDLTQESMAQLLGVRRASISRAAADLQRSGAIEYNRRGRLIILDRGKLEGHACACYRAIKADFDLLTKQ
ncbi:MAG: Crp/Fnr family transcriptional regulator [Bryobacteraceae bacterium]